MAKPSAVFKCSEEEKSKILSLYNTNAGELKTQVERLKEWIKTQPHLPDLHGSISLERVLVMNKLRLERTKQKVTTYFILKTILPDYFKQNPNTPKMIQASEAFYFTPMPSLTPDCNRVIIFQMRENKASKFDPIALFAYIINVYEIRMREEFRFRDIHVYDLKNATLEHAMKFTPMMLKKLSMMFEKTYDGSIATINFVNVPAYIQSFMNLIKSVLRTKMEQKIQIHSSFDTLFKFVPRENLPKDYGGAAESLAELRELWRQKFLEYDEIINESNSIAVNMDLLPEKLKMDDHFGVHGNFRKLDID